MSYSESLFAGDGCNRQVWVEPYTPVQSETKHSDEDIILIIIVYESTMAWQLFLIKKQMKYQIKEK